VIYLRPAARLDDTEAGLVLLVGDSDSRGSRRRWISILALRTSGTLRCRMCFVSRKRTITDKSFADSFVAGQVAVNNAVALALKG
jgi:hypothetical protein